MSNKGITEKTEPKPSLPEWTPAREAAPSVLRDDQANVARIIGMAGLFFIVIGSAVLGVVALGRVSRISPSFGVVMIVTGLGCLLYHAARDLDRQIRRSYGLLGYLLLLTGIAVLALPIRGSSIEVRFLPYGFTAFTLGLLFLMPFARNEDQDSWRLPAVRALGALGGILALTGFIASIISSAFILPYGLFLMSLGLCYLWAFIGLVGTSTSTGYWSAVALGAVGALFFVGALAASIINPTAMRGASASYFSSGGAILMLLGALYAGFSAGLCAENSFVVMTRRELASFFYSPIAYIVFFAMTVVGWGVYFFFVLQVAERSSPTSQPMLEPIVQNYIVAFFPVVCVTLIVPLLTMRLLSEEKRTGTLEVLLTAPVNETSVVLSKFFASLIFFMVLWIPWGLFLIGLRVGGGQPFDYRPLIAFFIALLFSGAGFLSMGLFFSSLTRNQIASAVLTAMGMLVLIGVYFGTFLIREGSAWTTILSDISYINLWQESLQGKLAPRALLVHLSAAIFWVFLAVKILESRKWK